jgi:hypothetical protein
MIFLWIYLRPSICVSLSLLSAGTTPVESFLMPEPAPSFSSSGLRLAVEDPDAKPRQRPDVPPADRRSNRRRASARDARGRRRRPRATPHGGHGRQAGGCSATPESPFAGFLLLAPSREPPTPRRRGSRRQVVAARRAAALRMRAEAEMLVEPRIAPGGGRGGWWRRSARRSAAASRVLRRVTVGRR